MILKKIDISQDLPAFAPRNLLLNRKKNFIFPSFFFSENVGALLIKCIKSAMLNRLYHSVQRFFFTKVKKSSHVY